MIRCMSMVGIGTETPPGSSAVADECEDLWHPASRFLGAFLDGWWPYSSIFLSWHLATGQLLFFWHITDFHCCGDLFQKVTCSFWERSPGMVISLWWRNSVWTPRRFWSTPPLSLPFSVKRAVNKCFPPACLSPCCFVFYFYIRWWWNTGMSNSSFLASRAPLTSGQPGGLPSRMSVTEYKGWNEVWFLYPLQVWWEITLWLGNNPLEKSDPVGANSVGSFWKTPLVSGSFFPKGP